MNEANGNPQVGDMWYEFWPCGGAGDTNIFARWRCLRVTHNGWYAWLLLNGGSSRPREIKRTQGWELGTIMPSRFDALFVYVSQAANEEAKLRALDGPTEAWGAAMQNRSVAIVGALEAAMDLEALETEEEVEK